MATLRRADARDTAAIRGLLTVCRMPVSAVGNGLIDYTVATDTDVVIGVVGIERHEDVGVLCSLAVSPSHRNQRIAQQLLGVLEAEAARGGMTRMVALTEDRAPYFERCGYQRVLRALAPEEIHGSAEFGGLEEDGKICLMKRLV